MHCRQFTICIAQNTHYLPPATSPLQFCIPNVSIFFPECYSLRVTETKTSACFLFYFIFFFPLKAWREVLLFIMEKSKGDELIRIIMIKKKNKKINNEKYIPPPQEQNLLFPWRRYNKFGILTLCFLKVNNKRASIQEKKVLFVQFSEMIGETSYHKTRFQLSAMIEQMLRAISQLK